MENTMDTVHITNKGWKMDILKRYYIFRETKLNNQMNDKPTVKSNIIFETIVHQDPHRGIPTTHNH
jgi:hypothetical protein